MNPRRRRGPFVVLATGLFLILSFNSVPSGSSVPSTPPPPPEEILALEQIATWLLGPTDGRKLLQPTDLNRAEPLAFELFRTYTDEKARHRFLVDLPFGREISEAAERQQLDGLLVAALVQVESSFAPEVVSPRGAVGLMQVLPSTARLYGRRDLTDPRANLEVGTRYLSTLLQRYGGSLELALAAYNAGPANVKRYGGIPPFPETRSYVKRVMSLYVDHHRQVWDATGATDLILFR